MKVSQLIARLQELPTHDLDVEIEPCEPECLGGGPIDSIWIENADDGRPIVVLSRVDPTR